MARDSGGRAAKQGAEPIVRKPYQLDGREEQTLRALVDVPALARRLFPRELLAETAGLDQEPRENETVVRSVPKIGANALQVLALLALEPEADVSRIVEALTLHKATVSGAVRELRDDHGLIEEEPITEDKRRRRYLMTTAGRDVVARMATRARAVLDAEDTPNAFP